MHPDDRHLRRLALARSLGCGVEELSPVEVGGVVRRRWRVTTRGNEHAIKVFDAFARDDAENDELLKHNAMIFRRAVERFPEHERELALATSLHRHILATFRYQAEEEENILTPGVALAMGEGDCEDHAMLLVAYARATGLDAYVTPLKNELGEITHAVAVIMVNGTPRWAETTVAAAFDEHPLAAVRRLQLARERPDVGR
jgi:Transglutaminase-like superfamily